MQIRDFFLYLALVQNYFVLKGTENICINHGAVVLNGLCLPRSTPISSTALRVLSVRIV